jgi:hypothetical protein
MRIDFSSWNLTTALEWIWKGFWATIGFAIAQKVLKFIPYI